MRTWLIRIIMIALVVAVPPHKASAGAWFNDDYSLNFSRPDWMGELSDDLAITALAIPGTHDTMALGDWNQPGAAQCQSVSLSKQLNAGIRALDIRCRHYYDEFPIHHGPFYQHANFTDVMNACQTFLSNYPSETILMKIQDEYDAEGNTRSFKETLMDYLDNYPTNLIWQTDDYSVYPTLGETRGKIIIINNWDSNDYESGIRWGPVDNQDQYGIENERSSFDKKWGYIKDQLIKASSGDPATLFSNFTSANIPDDYDLWDLWITPAKVADGKYFIEWPPWDSGWEDGMNERIYRYLRNKLSDGDLCRTGLIMMDYPGRGLIDVIVAHNQLGQLLATDPPVAVAGGPYVMSECATIQLDGSGSFDHDGDLLSYSWDFYSDGSRDTPWTNEYPYTLFTAGDNMDTNVTLAVDDGTGNDGMDTDIAALIITNVPPDVVIDGISSMIPGCIMPGHEVVFHGSFSDPGYLDTHLADWYFSEGGIAAGIITGENDPPDATGETQTTNTYASPGLYTVSLAVTDDDDGTGWATTEVLVRTPAQVCEFMIEFIRSLDRSAFSHPQAQHRNMVCRKLEALEKTIDKRDANGSVNKLANDLRTKWDGQNNGKKNSAWIIDPAAQEILCLTVDELILSLAP